MYNCKFKYETEERYELGQRSTMTHEYEVLKRDVSPGKPSIWASFCHYSDISVTFISSEVIRNLFVTLPKFMCG